MHARVRAFSGRIPSCRHTLAATQCLLTIAFCFLPLTFIICATPHAEKPAKNTQLLNRSHMPPPGSMGMPAGSASAASASGCPPSCCPLQKRARTQRQMGEVLLAGGQA